MQNCLQHQFKIYQKWEQNIILKAILGCFKNLIFLRKQLPIFFLFGNSKKISHKKFQNPKMSFDPPSATPNIGPRGAAGPKSQIFNFFKNSRVIPHLKRNFMLKNINKALTAQNVQRKSYSSFKTHIF